MTHYGGKELASAFKTVRTNTIEMAKEIPEEKYDFRASPDTRTIQETLVHIGVGTTFSNHVHRKGVSDTTTINFQDLMAGIEAEQAKKRTKADVIAFLQADCDSFTSYLDGLTDEFLAEEVKMPGGDPASKTRFEMLMAVKEHEMHHRGQLMLMQRMVGLVPHLTRRRQEAMARWQATQAKA